MTDTPKRLAGPAQVSNSPGTIYTVPSSTTAIIRNIHVYNPYTSALTFTLSVGTDAAGTRFYDAVNIPSKEALDWSGFLVMAQNEVMQATASSASQLVITVSGVEVT